jgi:hypothetical protein
MNKQPLKGLNQIFTVNEIINYFIDCPVHNSMRRQLVEKKGYTYEYLYELSSRDLVYLYNELIKYKDE